MSTDKSRNPSLTSIIAEHGAKVTNDVDNEENGTLLGPHCQIRTSSVSGNRMLSGSLDKQVKDGLWRAEHFAGGIGRKGKDHDYDEQHDGVHVIREECGLDTTEHGVDDDTNGQ
jgi:hypothetical protein